MSAPNAKAKAASFKAGFRQDQMKAMGGSSSVRAPAPPAPASAKAASTTTSATPGGPPGVKLPDINAKPGKQGAGVKAKAKAGAASADNSKTILNDVLASAGVDVVTTSASDGTTSSSKQKTAARLILGCVLRFQAQFEFRRTKQALLAEQLERETIEATARLEKKRFERQAVKKVEEMRKKKEQALKKTNFFDALYDGEAGEAQKLLEQDPKLLLEATDSDGHGPLAAAANGGSAEIVRMLLDYGCNPNLQLRAVNKLSLRVY
eukprot:CAMPEP_0178987830 /NCGR_PEP_ID=MMETSP0795-20121207/3486_1 /TAXON_ID=88552 /ORGANISM="Amoebophrya sp., Strain Ameob2" /LENGTH=263 /DNA_ID=CAMNT_0020679063 /DNA_START=342 /DNA_END=1133 /DNA_ORIENTATION=-